MIQKDVANIFVDFVTGGVGTAEKGELVPPKEVRTVVDSKAESPMMNFLWNAVRCVLLVHYLLLNWWVYWLSVRVTKLEGGVGSSWGELSPEL